MESKSYEIQSEIGNGGVRLDEKSRGIFRAVVMGRPSMVWLMNTMEALIKGDELRYVYRTFQIGNSVNVAERQENNHKKFMKLSEYSGEQRHSFVYRRVKTTINGAIASLK